MLSLDPQKGEDDVGPLNRDVIATFAYSPVVHVNNVEEHYAAVNDAASAGAIIQLSPEYAH